LRKLSPEEYNHLRNAMISLILRHGSRFRNHLEDLADFWHGPLYDGGVPLCVGITMAFNNSHIAQILSENPQLGQEIQYTRDFWEGLIDCACTKIVDGTKYPRLEFSGRQHVKDFILSEESGVPIYAASTPDRPANYTRTTTIPFLCIPPSGNASDYFAGALAGSSPVISKSGALCCKMKKSVLDVLK